eukprot:g7505.t1
MLSKQVNLLYTIVLSSCIARLYSVHVPEEKNIQQIEVGDFALINYKPDLEDDEDTLEDNICMEVETVDIQTGATATSLMIEYVSGDEICWDKGEELKLKTVMIRTKARRLQHVQFIEQCGGQLSNWGSYECIKNLNKIW